MTAPAPRGVGREMMPAGREMDALIAERIFGFRREAAPKDYDGEHGGNEVLVPPTATLAELEPILPRKGPIPFDYLVGERYSTDIAAAWQVVERLQPDVWVKLHVGRSFREDFVPIVDCYIGHYGSPDAHVVERGIGAPLAICRAALRAAEARQP